MKTNIVFIVVLLLSISSVAQSHDSLATVLKYKIAKATTDSARIGYKIELVKQMHRFDLEASRIIINDILKQIEEIQGTTPYYQKNKAKALNYLGIVDNKQGNAEKALTTYLKALDISEGINDSITIGLGFHNLGMFYRRQKDYEKSKQYYKFYSSL
ncbi:tetratricopeptide repeat protein [Aquimarina sp. RZ0]|uniref:tetratricopeptide repeat protein n=1 Tax=Aquimarina sp. RZ0 TaxID=2607730 RepID=UPI0011F3DD22|nr:tetratricopeptide repeat protein [Aquimarina sp. RZ0]KAA1243034.1 tetratricopeptide repeat protein [Aquimarina sp. RZ0]